jgi:16S rRNA (guanine527-N7)-methyltransferase
VEVEGRAELLEVLEGARARGLVGPGPVAAHLDHALAWAEVLGPAPGRFLDLGTGGGVPGLVLARLWPEAEAVLLDSRRRALEWVQAAAGSLGVEGRVRLVEARAEEAGRDPELRETFELVVARGFGPPPVTAECGAAFVTPGGRLSVSEPPAEEERGPVRWPEESLAELALGPATVRVTGGGSFAVLTKTGRLDDRWPRAVGRPGRRPLWG